MFNVFGFPGLYLEGGDSTLGFLEFGWRVQGFSGLAYGFTSLVFRVSLALACELHYIHDFFKVSLGLACGVYFIRVSVAESFTSIGFAWVWLVRFFHGRLFFRVGGVGCGVFDFFRVL